MFITQRRVRTNQVSQKHKMKANIDRNAMNISDCRRAKVSSLSLYMVVMTIMLIMIKVKQSHCSVTGSIIDALKKRIDKLKSYEERKPKLDEEKSISPYVKRQLYWYYKDLIAHKELSKIWKGKDKHDNANITEKEIFMSDFLLPTKSDTLKFGKFMGLDDKKNTSDLQTQLSYNMTQLKQGIGGLVLNRMIGKGTHVLIDNLGKVLNSSGGIHADTLNSNRTAATGESDEKTESASNSDYYIWGKLVSPCDGEVQFNVILNNSLKYEDNISLYIIYCYMGGIRERYSQFGGRVTEFLNGRYEILNGNVVHHNSEEVDKSNSVFRRAKNNTNRGVVINLERRYKVGRGDVLMRIIERYYPPILQEDLTTIPVFMPCKGTVVWDKKHKYIFTKGERILEFKCEDEVKVRQLISPSRGYTELVDIRDEQINRIIESMKSQGFSGGYISSEEYEDQVYNDYSGPARSSSKTIPIGHLVGLMKLEVKYRKHKDSDDNRRQDELKNNIFLIKMPCIGKVEYPLLKSNFVLKDEVLYVVRCVSGNGKSKTVFDNSNVQGIVQLLVENQDIVRKNVYILRIFPRDLSEVDFNSNSEFPKYKHDLSLAKKADPIAPLYIER